MEVLGGQGGRAVDGSPRFMVVSQIELRRLVGGLGALLPVVLVTSGYMQCRCPLQPTISHYYDLGGVTRDLFVGILFAIATFFWTYRGYDSGDRWTARVASACAFGVALFPHAGTQVLSLLHFASAVGLFGALAHFALRLFPKAGATPTREKLWRNRIYRACGWIIVMCIGAITVLVVMGSRFAWSPVFWLEALAFWAFAISWLVKGEVVLRDAVAPATRAGNLPEEFRY
jgi:hypothetical protein